jgi:hypothetical protein
MSLYGNTGNSFKNNPIADFFAGLGQFGKKFGEVSQQTQKAQVNPYGGASTTKAPTKTTLSGITEAQRRAIVADKKTGYGLAAGSKPTGTGAKLTAAQRFGTPGGNAGGGPINNMFDPLFKMIESQRAAADARYAANQGNIETIYGQLTSARRDDVDSTTKAYKALSDAASARSTAVSGNIDSSEAARLSANDAVLQSLGLSDVASARMGDVASEQAATAKSVEGLNSSNWQGMLSAMGANAQDVISQDVNSYGYQQARDINALSSDLQNYQQALDTRQFETQAEKGQAKFQFNQAQKAAQAAAAASAARASASAANSADRAATARAQELLKYADPLTKAITRGVELGYGDFNPTKVQDAYNNWMINRGTSPTAAGVAKWNKLSATADALKYAGDQLSNDEKRALQEAIGNSY